MRTEKKNQNPWLLVCHLTSRNPPRFLQLDDWADAHEKEKRVKSILEEK